MRAHAGLVHGMTCVKNPAMMRTPDKMLPPPPTKRGSRCRPGGGNSISHTAETTIAKPLGIQSTPTVASAELTAAHSRNTSAPALVVAKPKTRNAAPISRSTSTLAAIRTSLVVNRLLGHSNPSTHRTALALCRRSCVSKEACEVVNHQQRPGKRNCFVYRGGGRRNCFGQYGPGWSRLTTLGGEDLKLHMQFPMLPPARSSREVKSRLVPASWLSKIPGCCGSA